MFGSKNKINVKDLTDRELQERLLEEQAKTNRHLSTVTDYMVYWTIGVIVYALISFFV